MAREYSAAPLRNKELYGGSRRIVESRSGRNDNDDDDDDTIEDNNNNDNNNNNNNNNNNKNSIDCNRCMSDW